MKQLKMVIDYMNDFYPEYSHLDAIEIDKSGDTLSFSVLATTEDATASIEATYHEKDKKFTVYERIFKTVNL